MIGSIILLIVFYAILIGAYYMYKVFSADRSACFGLSPECDKQSKATHDDKNFDEALGKKCDDSNQPFGAAVIGMLFTGACTTSSGALWKCYEDLALENPDMFGKGGTHSYITELTISRILENTGNFEFSRAEIIKSYMHCNYVIAPKFKTSWLYFGDGF
tara:strand:+ start:13825 stop:14304 length:480 start_codon:yes stop_codon:yes gene_type:complete